MRSCCVLCIKWDEEKKKYHKCMRWFFSCLALMRWKKKKNRAKHKVGRKKAERKIHFTKNRFFFIYKIFLFILFRSKAKARKNYGEILFISKTALFEDVKSKKKILWVVSALYWWGAFFFFYVFSSFYDSFRFFFLFSANCVSCLSHHSKYG